ncbi:glycosyltransferase [Salinicola sp. V024]|uniref:glycosyltransferase n=1 Tax=Salinicola sp. V024 TaxID=3459609 RepID=UPI004043B87D
MSVKSKIALLLPSLVAGGVGRSILHLAGEFIKRGHDVDLVLCRHEGAYVNAVPKGVRIVTLAPSNPWVVRWQLMRFFPKGLSSLAYPALLSRKPAPVQRYLPDLVHYLVTTRPDALLAAKTHTNLLAIWAKQLAGVSTRIIVSERTQLSVTIANTKKWRWRYVAPLIAHSYPYADRIVAVSNGVADDLVITTGLARQTVQTIYNPTVTPQIAKLATELPSHPWLSAPATSPVIVAAGRLVTQKNFKLLLRAFALLRTQYPARLIILGEGDDRAALEALGDELGISEDISLPGFVDNPYAYFARAALFVLSSNYEGLPGVLIQALACGCPVVSTDCPSGPDEILANGKYGCLSPVGNVDALANAMRDTLSAPLPSHLLIQHANMFSLKRSANEFLEILLPDRLSTHGDLAHQR